MHAIWRYSMAIVRSPAPAAPTEEQLPYGPEFQKGLIKLLCDDPAFATSICPHLKPKYFSAPPLAWAYAAIEQYREQYGATPTTLAMMDIARNAKSAEAPVYVSLIDSIEPRREKLEHRARFRRKFQHRAPLGSQRPHQGAKSTLPEVMILLQAGGSRSTTWRTPSFVRSVRIEGAVELQ